MKIICLTGHSGSGKTTASEILQKNLPNSIFIGFDDYMIESVLYYTKEFYEIFGFHVDKDNPRKSLVESTELGKEKYIKYMEMINPFIESKTPQAIEQQKILGKDYLIIDYWYLPKLNIWKNADYRIIIDAPQQIRHERIRARTIKRLGFCNEGRIKVVEQVTEQTFKDVKNIDFTIINIDKKKFEHDLKEVCDKIKGFL